MQQRNIILAGVLGLGLSGAALAQQPPACAGGTFQARGAIVTLLGGKTVCAVLGNQVWQEVHNGTSAVGGQLYDLKGTSNPTQELVGSWSVVGSGNTSRVRYNYGSGGTYDYSVWVEGTGASRVVHFCGATNVTNARVIDSGACP